MITDDMTDWHQTNKQNKTIKQLAAAWIHQSPNMETIPPAGNQIFRGKYEHLLLVSTTVTVRLLIISLKTAVKRCHKSQSILQTKVQNTLSPLHSCASPDVPCDMSWCVTPATTAENGREILYYVNTRDPLCVLYFLHGQYSIIQCSLQANNWLGDAEPWVLFYPSDESLLICFDSFTTTKEADLSLTDWEGWGSAAERSVSENPDSHGLRWKTVTGQYIHVSQCVLPLWVCGVKKRIGL